MGKRQGCTMKQGRGVRRNWAERVKPPKKLALSSSLKEGRRHRSIKLRSKFGALELESTAGFTAHFATNLL